MDKIAMQIGPLTLHWYGVFVALGFILGLWTASRRGIRHGVSAELVMDLGPWLLVGSILGARILYVISYWKRDFADQPLSEIFMIHHGGLVYYGGLIGASLTVILYTHWKKLPLWKLADALAPSIALGHVFGRLGCFMNGCCFGKPTSLPWAVHFPPTHPTHPHGVHPSQIYESLLNLGLYLALAAAYRKKKFDGQIFALYLIAYSLLRSFNETFRGDYEQHYLGGWATPAHLVSLLLLPTGLGLYLWFHFKNQKTTSKI